MRPKQVDTRDDEAVRRLPPRLLLPIPSPPSHPHLAPPACLFSQSRRSDSIIFTLSVLFAFCAWESSFMPRALSPSRSFLCQWPPLLFALRGGFEGILPTRRAGAEEYPRRQQTDRERLVVCFSCWVVAVFPSTSAPRLVASFFLNYRNRRTTALTSSSTTTSTRTRPGARCSRA